MKVIRALRCPIILTASLALTEKTGFSSAGPTGMPSVLNKSAFATSGRKFQIALLTRLDAYLV